MTVAPIFILFLSALITWFTRNRHNRTQWVLSSLLGFVIWAFMLAVNVEDAVVFEISVWQPKDLFQSPISLTIDSVTWPLMYGSVTVLLAVILTAATRQQVASAGVRSFWFLYTAFALIAIMSGNLLTTMIAWTIMDFGMLGFLLAVSENPVDRRAVFGRAGINAVSVLLILASSMASELEGVLTLDLTSTSAVGIMLLAIAATFRLGVIPLHFTLPPITPLRRGVGTLLRLFSPVVAMVLLARVFEAGIPDVLQIIFILAGAIGGLLGSLRWMLQRETVNSRPFFVLGLASFALVIATIAPNGSEVIISAGLVILLVGAVISLYAQHTPSHRLIPIAASLLLIGLPFTPAAVYANAVADLDVFLSSPVSSLIAVVSSSLLALGCFQLFFRAETAWPIGESLPRVMFNVGLVLPILAAIGIGSWQLKPDPLGALIFFLAALAIGVLLLLLFRVLSVDQIDRLRQLFRTLDPGRVYQFLWDGLQRFLVAIRRLGELFEGPSAMLWLIVFVVFILFIIQ